MTPGTLRTLIMKKYTATFTCDRELWDEFKSWAHSINSSASEQISKFMKTAVTKEIEPKTSDYIDGVIDQKIQNFVDEKLNDLIDRRYKVNSKDPDPNTDYKLGTDSKPDRHTVRVIANHYKGKYPEHFKQKEETNTDNTDSPKEALSSYLKESYTDTDDTDSTATRKPLSGTEDQITLESTPQEKQYYLDREVAKIERIDSYSVKRYRVGLRKPRDKSFFKRWKFDKDGLGWIRINSDKE